MSSTGGHGRPPYPPLPGSGASNGPRRSSAQSPATATNTKSPSASYPQDLNATPASMAPKKRPAEASSRGNSPPIKQTKLPESRNDTSKKYVSPRSPVGQRQMSSSKRASYSNYLNAPTGPAARTRDGRRVDSYEYDIYRPDSNRYNSYKPDLYRNERYISDQRLASSASQTRKTSFDGQSPLNTTMSPMSAHGETAAPGSGASPIQSAPVAPSMAPSIPPTQGQTVTGTKNYLLPAELRQRQLNMNGRATAPITSASLMAKRDRTQQLTNQTRTRTSASSTDREREKIYASQEIEQRITALEQASLSYKTQLGQIHNATEEADSLRKLIAECKQNIISTEEKVKEISSRVDDMGIKASSRMDAMDSQLKLHLDKIRTESSRMDAMDAQLKSHVDKIRTESSSRMDAMDAQLKSHVDKIRTESSSRMDAMDAQLKSHVDKIRTESSRMNVMDAQLNSRIDVMEAEFTSRVDGMKTERTLQPESTSDIKSLDAKLSSRIDAVAADITSVNNALLDAEQKGHALETDLETLKRDVPIAIDQAIQQHQPKSESPLTNEHKVVEVLMQDIKEANAAVQGVSASLQNVSKTTQYISVQLETQRVAFATLENRYQEITTDDVYARMVKYWVTNYPDASKLYERVEAVQHKAAQVTADVAQLSQTLSALQARVAAESSMRMDDQQKIQWRVGPLEEKITQTRNELASANESLSYERSKRQEEQKKLEKRITSISQDLTKLLKDKDQIEQAAALVPHHTQALGQLREMVRSINENSDHPLNLGFASDP